MIKKILLSVFVLIGIILIIASFQPNEFKVSRTILISAQAESIFPYINNAKRAYDWMPWAESDQGVEIKYSGPEEGLGAMSSWQGDKMGIGSSEVVESNVNKNVKTKLVYSKPFEMTQMAEISLNPMAEGTEVTWSVEGERGLFFKVMGIFFGCDKMIGAEFEKGLAKLKKIVETNN